MPRIAPILCRTEIPSHGCIARFQSMAVVAADSRVPSTAHVDDSSPRWDRKSQEEINLQSDRYYFRNCRGDSTLLSNKPIRRSNAAKKFIGDMKVNER